MQTLAREVTYHPLLKQLVFSPLKEQASLRQKILGSIENVIVTTAKKVELGPFIEANQSDVILRVGIPKTSATLYITVTALVKIEFYINFVERDGDNVWTEMEVGMLTEDPYVSIKDTLKMLDSDNTLELRLFLDHEITEAYWQGGRVAMTVPSPLTNATSVILSTDSAGATLNVDNVTIWNMKPAWISKQELLAQEKSDNAGLAFQ